ncbi:SDR family NAD(P)-dependent oxidoreductase [Microbacterium immunditiarum]|uniref:NAD(P)-dependent dehydrogenase (Short-subunit alcohol dehydrogenase family) n=1 Tax=Microbacterium immunditiarum TaxID=337480 RepID=A0A7Y9KJH0_9MICO|nr:SDR family NAD(P)-dependent oxidoreductase [Microbacterium immunditiarum]NYE19641.1 NAD(P)-dependent dehydrogenase (short-subunit alcohol dehydrogenase family) [Microbacterium immunditiarum]
MSLLAGKVALVTGAGHGIGRGHALELAKHGAKVVVNDLGGTVNGEGRGRDADVVVDLIRARGGEAIADYGDVGDEGDAQAMIQRAIAEFGQLDIVVNNAGIVRDRVVWKMTPDDFDLVMRVHVRGTWLLSHFAALHWRERAAAGERLSARIINTTSGAGLLGNFGQSNYAAAKAAIAGMTLTLSLELAKIGVTVNCIAPAGNTRITATLGSEAPRVREADEYAPDEYHPMDPSISSPVVAWLASDEAAYVNGQVIRAVGEDLQVLQPWSPASSICGGGKRWDASTLGLRFGRELYRSQARGVVIG